MGGLGAYSVGLRNPDFFTGIVSFFGAFAYGQASNPVTISNNVSAEYLQYFSHYFNSGNRDVYGFGREAVQLDQILRSKGVDHYYFIENGEHDSAFYIPFFKQAMAYTGGNMFDTKGAIAQAVSGSVEVETGEESVSVTGTVQLGDEIASYMNIIPASSFTVNQHPDLVIPVTVYLEQNGKRVAAQTEFYSVAGAGDLDVSVEIVSDDLDLEQPYSVRVVASLLDTNVELGEF